jgi:hypothetical protein
MRIERKERKKKERDDDDSKHTDLYRAAALLKTCKD